jgi:dUTP pyrophosphatase
MPTLTIPVQKLPHAQNLPLPDYASSGAAGMDLCAALPEPVQIDPGRFALIPTGLAIALPMGFEAQIRSRSGLAAKNGVMVLNSPGTIDADYRGEIKVILCNFGSDRFIVDPGMRIAQMVIARHERVQWQETQTLDETARGSGGFGSTGTASPKAA